MHDRDDNYRSFLRKVGTGVTISEAEWLFHFDHQNTDGSDGVAVGEIAPDFALVDDAGNTRTRAEPTGARGLLSVFARSADW